MRTFTIGTALLAALLLVVGVAAAQPKKPDCPPSPSASPGAATRAPGKIEGTVTDIDGQSHMVTLRDANGQIHQFRGNAETIKDLKVGDKLELNKRVASAKDC